MMSHELENIHLPTLIGLEFGVSRSDARRMISQGAVTLNGAKVTALDAPRALLDGKTLGLGKRRTRQLSL